MYDDAQDALAAEYVLGTLSADEREHAEALLTLDPAFATSVQMWERRLGELNVMVEAVEPPPEVWDKIKAEIGDVPQPSVPQPSVPQPSVPQPSVPQASAPQASVAPSEPPVLATDVGALTPPVESLPPAPTLPSDVPPLLLTDAPGEDSIPIPAALESTGELPNEVSDSITASLAKSLSEPSPPEPPPPADFSDWKAPPVVPPIEPKVERSANVVLLSRRVSRWRGMTVLMGTIAALLAIYVGLNQFAPGLIPFGPHPAQQVAQGPAQPQQLGARLVAVLQQEPTAPAFLLTVDPQTRTMVVRRVSATAEPGRSYELWLIAGQAAPKSLGVVGADEFTQRPLPGSFDAATLRNATYAVSLEPSGGSPSGAPTGPVLFTGKIVESVPIAAPTPKT
jgi:anti-sigma-K factor RskA